MDGDALQRRADMLADKTAATRQHLDIAIEIDMRIRHLAPTLGGEDKHRADSAIDVDPAVGSCRAGEIGKLIQLGLAI